MPEPRNESALPGTEPVTVEGVVDKIVFESADSGFFVGRVRETGTNELVTIVGTVMAVSPGETIRLRGHWVNDKKFGRQLRTESWETLRPNSIEGIEKYLGSGLIKGIGPTYAKRLIEAFGADTLTIIDEHPERVQEVAGIGRKRAEQIQQAWASQKSVRAIMVFLQGHGISTGQAAKIYKRYGDGAVAVLRENPYRLAEDIAGIGFAGADKVAESLGVEKTSPRRLQAGLLFALQEAAGDGHVCVPDDRLLAGAAELLGVDAKLLPQALADLESQRQVVRQQTDCYLAALHQAEAGCAHHVKRLLAAEKAPVSIDIDKALAWIESKQAITLSEEQSEALRVAVQARLLVITGGPGTGKTTLVKGLISMFEAKGLSVLLAAPTGRAAKRMEAATGRPSSTIHRLLEFSPRTGGFVRTEYDPLRTDMVVIDECSMVDVYLLHALLRALPSDCRAVFVGDVDQLPSVGPGNVLMDIIASNAVPTVRLRTVFRQAAESGIIRNAHRINRGENPEFNADDFFFVERPEAERAVGTVVELVTARIPRKFGMDPMRDVQVLSPMHRGPVGVANLNQALQAALNPRGAVTSRRGFRIGDRVIQQRNNYDLDVFNGDMGRIEAVDEDAQSLTVVFDGRPVIYGFDELDDLSLAYAITVHKSQGSEYPAVVIPLVSQHYMLLQRNVLYTGVTRAKKLVVLVGDPKALRRALHNTEVTRRHTRLAERLRNEI
jgi:exodeoxyribonuclease V alpha subunit